MSAPPQELSVGQVLREASGAALRGGLAGAASQALSVGLLMWMRTIMNYQYRFGGSFRDVLSKLYAEGGVARLYRGVIPALFQAPLSRFGDTAANVGMLALLDNSNATRELPVAAKMVAASAAAAVFRVGLMPIDA